MQFAQESLDRFISSYERNTTNNDLTAVVNQFADPFLAAGPDGSIIVPAAGFAQKLPSRKQYLEEAGLCSSKLIARRDTAVSDRYVLVSTEWQMDFVPADKPAATLTVSSSFLIDLGGGEPKILVYLTHQDLFQLLQEKYRAGK
jgi:hypothetical protein